ncbi:MAG: Flp pilus assembly complex ATPase component TadA, partial [Burkholderiales bacterium]
MASVATTASTGPATQPAVQLSGLARALVQHQLLRLDQAIAVQGKADSAKARFLDELVGSGMLTALQVAVFAAEKFGHPLLDLNAVDIDTLPHDAFDARITAQGRVLALSKRGNRLAVATCDPTDQQTLDRIKFQTECVVEPIIVEHDKLVGALERIGQSAGQQLADLIGEVADVDLTNDELASSVSLESQNEVEDAPVVKFLQKVLLDAINNGASDLHFEPYEKFYRIRFRIDGELREMAQPPLAIKEKLASRIKVISRLDIAERRVPQDGRMKLVLSHSRAIDFRVSTLPTLFGEKIVMRILDPSSARLGIEALGYDPEQQQSLLDAIQRPYGMVLVTGPTGSGKTVSLYTCLNILNEPGINISTAEDPAEINLPGVNQVNVNEKAGLTFAAALRAFLRQDPDIIMVGE